jgi:hypothetical protein
MENHSAKKPLLDMERWRKIVDAWDGKIETQSAYCQRLGISLNSFSYARSKLQHKSKSKLHFVPLNVKSSKVENFSTIILLENPSGYRLHIPVSLSADQLKKIFNISGWNNA